MNQELLQIVIQNFFYRFIQSYYIVGMFKEFEFLPDGSIGNIETESFAHERKTENNKFEIYFDDDRETAAKFSRRTAKKIIKQFQQIDEKMILNFVNVKQYATGSH